MLISSDVEIYPLNPTMVFKAILFTQFNPPRNNHNYDFEVTLFSFLLSGYYKVGCFFSFHSLNVIESQFGHINS